MERENAAITAERLTRRRARVMTVFAIFFVVWQANFLSAPEVPVRAVDHFKISAWFVWALVLLCLLVTGGGWFQAPRCAR